MNFPVQLLLLIIKCLCLSSAACPTNAKGEGKIVGGHDAQPHSHPYMVSLQTRILFMRMHICGGVLLNKRYVLSAAHCASESWLIRWLPMDAVAGLHNVNQFRAQTQIIRIEDRLPHPRYNGGIGPHDIALFRTISPFTYTNVVQPIKLATSTNYKSGGELKLAGWGALKTTSFVPDLPSRLQEVGVSYIPYKACYNAINELLEPYEENPLDDESNICTGSLTGGIAACIGDSGGPLVQIIDKVMPAPNDTVEESTELYNASLYDCPYTKEIQNKQNNSVETVLLGIVSWGVSPCGEKGAPTVYTNVTAYKFFIEYNTRDFRD